jgi:hypothetical protein
MYTILKVAPIHDCTTHICIHIIEFGLFFNMKTYLAPDNVYANSRLLTIGVHSGRPARPKPEKARIV